MLKRLAAVVALFWLLEMVHSQILLQDGPGIFQQLFRREASRDIGPRFDVIVRGGLLRLDFWAPARVETIQVYDLQGRLLFTFRSGKVLSVLGWIWDGRDQRGRLLSRGRYHIRVRTRDGVLSRTVAWDPAP